MARDVTGAAPAGRLDASMTLLREVMERPLDPGYAAAAAERRPRTRRRTAVTLLLAIVSGYLFAVAVSFVRTPQPDQVQATQRLRDEVTARTEAVRSRGTANAALRAEVDAARDRALQAAGGSALLAQARTLGLLTGELPVRGPGVRFTVDDAPGSRGDGVNGDPRAGSAAAAGVVLDSDLQIVVNGLWQAGAEAIAVNGQRLTSLSAIRSAGEAILVDFRPLVPPYVVEAVGEPRKLQTGFASGAAGAYVQSMRDNSGIPVAIQARDAVELPAATQLRLRSAVPDPAAVTGTSPASPSGGPSSSGASSSGASVSGPALNAPTAEESP